MAVQGWESGIMGYQLKLVELVLRLLGMPKWGEGEIKIIVI